MAASSFKDLLSAAMSESGLIDLETSDGRTGAGDGSHIVVNSQPVVGIPASQELMSASLQPPQIQSNSIIIQKPQIQKVAESCHSVAVQSSTDTQKGVHKIVVRTLPTRLQLSLPSRQLHPVLLRTTNNRQQLMQTNITSAAVVAVTTQHTIINSRTAPSLSTVCIPGTAARPVPSPGTLRFTAIPRPLSARLPTGETVHIRPRLPASTAAQQPTAPAAGIIMQPVSQARAGQTTVPLTASTTVVSVSLLPSTVSSCVAPLQASSATSCVNSAPDSVVTVSCAPPVPNVTNIQNRTSCVIAGSSSSLSYVTSTSTDSQVLLQSNADSCSTVASSLSTSAIVSVPTDTVKSCSPVMLTESSHSAASLQQPDAVNRMLTSSENLAVTAASSEAVNANSELADAKEKSNSTTISCSAAEAEADDQQVRYVALASIV